AIDFHASPAFDARVVADHGAHRAGVDRAINSSVSARAFTGEKGACLAATDARHAPWCAVSLDSAGAKRYISRLIRSPSMAGWKRWEFCHFQNYQGSKTV